MTYELQHSDIAQPKLLDADPVTDKWPLPPVKRWAPVSGFDLDAMCKEAEQALAAYIAMRASVHWSSYCRKFRPSDFTDEGLPKIITVRYSNLGGDELTVPGKVHAH